MRAVNSLPEPLNHGNRGHAILQCMADGEQETVDLNTVVSSIKREIDRASPSRRKRIFEAIALAALNSIPWVGGVLATAVNFKIRETDSRRDGLAEKWLEEHQQKLQILRETLERMVLRLEG